MPQGRPEAIPKSYKRLHIGEAAKKCVGLMGFMLPGGFCYDRAGNLS